MVFRLRRALFSRRSGPLRVPCEQTEQAAAPLTRRCWGEGRLLGILLLVFFGRLAPVLGRWFGVAADSGLRLVSPHLELPLVGELPCSSFTQGYLVRKTAVLLLGFPSIERRDPGCTLVGPDGTAREARHQWATEWGEGRRICRGPQSLPLGDS